ncbi:MAG: PAS domain S-box protein [Sphingobacteriia bacterium]|nr:MAG: PAS domain S-box protein [Sphingobacteriia bacterium]
MDKVYHILAIEDNLGDFLILEDYLREGFKKLELVRAKKFKEAADLFSQSSIYFDIVLLDLTLPDKSGESLIIEMVDICNGCPIIALTDFTDIKLGTNAFALGICDYLLKEDINASSLQKCIYAAIERKITQQKLEASEKKYSNLFHLSPQPMWVFELETLKFKQVNESAIKHYGYTEEEFLSMTILDLRPKSEITTFLEAFNKMDTQLGAISSGKFKHKKKDGTIINMDTRGYVLEFEGKISKHIVANDVTEVSSYISAIEKQNNKLKEIAWIQSHKIRAPLAKIMGFVNLLHSDFCSDTEKKELLDYLKTSSVELDSVLKDITEISQDGKITLS